MNSKWKWETVLLQHSTSVYFSLRDWLKIGILSCQCYDMDRKQLQKLMQDSVAIQTEILILVLEYVWNVRVWDKPSVSMILILIKTSIWVSKVQVKDCSLQNLKNILKCNVVRTLFVKGRVKVLLGFKVLENF